jgi:WD repeat-containing protein 35
LGLDLAKRYAMGSVENLLSQYSTHLLSSMKYTDAIQLFRKAGRHLEAAKLLFHVSVDESLILLDC